MTMFLIQSLLWLLAAFLLGYGLARWLKGVFCKRKQVQAPPQFDNKASHLRVPVTTAAVATGTAAAAALARSREPVRPTVTVKQPEVKAPVITVKVPEPKASVTPLKTAEINLPKVEIKAPQPTVATPILDLNPPDLELPKVALSTPKVDLDLPKVDVKLPVVDLPKVDLDLPKVDVTAPKLDINVPKVDLDLPEVDVDLTKLDLGSPRIEMDLPKVDLRAPRVEMDLPEVDVDVTAPKLDINVPKVDLDLPKVDVKVPVVDLPKVDLDLPKVEVAVPDLDLPSVEVSVPSVPRLEIEQPKIEVELPEVDLTLPSLDLPKVEAGLELAETKLPELGLPKLEVKDMTTGIIGLGAAALGVAATKLTAAAGEVDLSATERVKPSNSELELQALQLNLPDAQADLSAAEWQDNAVNVSAVALKLPEAQVKLPEVNLPTLDGDLALEPAKVDLGLVELKTPEGLATKAVEADLSPDLLDTVKKAAAGAGLGAVVAKVGSVLADTPKPVDESDLIESAKTVVLEVERAHEGLGLESGTPEQVLNIEATAGSRLAVDSESTLAAVQANLQSGVQPMIVDESDAIEAIKLAWDGELSPAELAALEHTLILRPGETGRLGLVTCSVTGTDCVALGGLEADLQAGDAMRSKLFNMAVTHNDDGNYVFSSLSKWLPDWVKSGDFAGHTDELVNLVWDNDPTAFEHTAGYQLTLCEGQYGDLGLVSCAVNEPGSVSLGGLVGSIADGQTAVSKLYGLVIERTGEVYTFKQFTKPQSASDSSLLTATQAVAVALGTGAMASVSGASEAVKDFAIPVTTSTPTDLLEPDLDWDIDKVRINLHRLIEESHDRRGSKLVSQLWDADSGYDCGVIEGEESLVLKPGLYGKLGSVHCGVTKPGRVVVSGDASALAEGEGVLFHLYNIVVCRDDEDNYRFERLKDLVN